MDVISQSNMEFSVILKLNESEARALDALVGYGFDPFIKAFYENLGKHYMEPHEAGCRSLFATAKKELPKHFKRIDETRKVFKAKV